MPCSLFTTKQVQAKTACFLSTTHCCHVTQACAAHYACCPGIPWPLAPQEPPSHLQCGDGQLHHLLLAVLRPRLELLLQHVDCLCLLHSRCGGLQGQDRRRQECGKLNLKKQSIQCMFANIAIHNAVPVEQEPAGLNTHLYSCLPPLPPITGLLLAPFSPNPWSQPPTL